MSNPSSVRHRASEGSSTLESIFESISLAVRLRIYTITCYFLSHPLLLRLVFAFVRRVRPIAIVRNYVVVAKAKDVREVLDRLADFTLAEDLGPKIPWGPFVVTIDWPEQHARERQLLQSVVSSLADVDRIRNAAATLCRARIAQAQSLGRIDVVKDLCEPVLVDTVQNYFGIPSIGSADEMATLLGRVASFIMVEPPTGSARRIESLDSIARLSRTIVDQINLIKGLPAPATGPDLLTRLVAKLTGKGGPTWLDESWIRRYMTGLAVFGGGTIIRATTQAIDQLIRHPADLQEARALAVEIDRFPASGPSSLVAQQRIEAARESLLQIIYEALRFRPMLPILTRYVPRETIVAKDVAHARLVPAGATLLAPPIAAMFDPEEFPNPWRFSRARCLKGYVHFGHGPRHCFGKYVADVLMVEIFRSLLLCDDLKRAAGSSGRIAYDGAAARSLVLTFRP